MKGVFEDIRHALRLYRRTPGASLMVVAVLAVGMAFVAAFLSLYSDLILRPEPGFERGGGRIVSVGWSDGKNAGGLTLDLVERFNEQLTTLEAVAGASVQQFRVGPEEEQLLGEVVTGRFFSGLRPKLALGEGFMEVDHDPDAEPVVVLSWRYWQDKYAGQPDVLGKTLRIQGPPRGPPPPGMGPAPEEEPAQEFRIVGVMDRGYTGTVPPGSQLTTSFWIPVERGIAMMTSGVPAQYREQQMQSLMRSYGVRGMGRLASGASVKAAVSELNARFSDEEFIQRPGAKYEVIDRIVQSIFVQRETERQLQLFLGASLLLALVAAANVSLFLLARAPGRRRELGIRMAVGAPLKRLGRQLVSEAAVLVLAAAAVSLGLSVWLAQFLRGLPFLRAAQWRDVTLLDWRVLGLVGAFLLLVTLLVSLAPVLGLKRLGIAASSRQVAARATPAQRFAGTAQIAVAGALGGAALAFAWHLTSALMADPGYRLNGLKVVPYTLAVEGRGIRIMMTPDGKASVEGLVDAARRREVFEAIPGITAVSFAGAVPGLLAGVDQTTVADPQNPDEAVRVRSMLIDSSFVDLLGLKLRHGQNVSDSDPGGVLVNQAFAQRFYGREDVSGEPLPPLAESAGQGQIRVRGASAMIPALMGATHIVGVLPDLSFGNPLDDIDPMIFTSSGISFGGVAIMDTALPAEVLQKQLQEAMQTLDLNAPGNLITVARAHSDMLAPDRARGLLTIGTALLVVLLAAFGFHGTQRYLVMAGRREYAIRASLGAGPKALGGLVFRRGFMLGLPGLLLGAPLAYILVAWLRGDYVAQGVSPVLVTMAVVAGLAALLWVASIGPSRLARSTQPAPLLRED